MRDSLQKFYYESVCFVFLLLSAIALCAFHVQAAETETVDTSNLPRSAGGSADSIYTPEGGNVFFKVQATDETVDSDVTVDVTPDEPANSDLEIILRTTPLDFHRWTQSYTQDDNYYYFLQVTNPYKGHLRITRIKHSGMGQGYRDHMDLKFFGHGTNIDCSEFDGRTYLWTGSNAASGSDVSRAVSCFNYVPGATIKRHGGIYYRIPKGRRGKYVTNVYPAVNEKSDRLAVRFTYRGKQYFQVYKLTGGTRINIRKPLKQRSFGPTAGDFQGFDIGGTNKIYTIEGSPNAAFLKKYDKNRAFQPTIIRTYNLSSGARTYKKIKGAKKLTFREPEGIKLLKGGEIRIMFVSFRLTDQRVNLYRVK